MKNFMIFLKNHMKKIRWRIKVMKSNDNNFYAEFSLMICYLINFSWDKQYFDCQITRFWIGNVEKYIMNAWRANGIISRNFFVGNLICRLCLSSNSLLNYFTFEKMVFLWVEFWLKKNMWRKISQDFLFLRQQ